MNDTIEDVLALARDEARSNKVTIRTEYADDLSPVLGDRIQLQVVLNLVMNAIEAMSTVGEGRRLMVIITGNVDDDKVQVTIKDSRTGLDAETVERIFDPFYTTKPGGIGMGLAI